MIDLIKWNVNLFMAILYQEVNYGGQLDLF